MPKSSCPKCGKHQFERAAHEAQGSREVIMLVQCTECGTVVGVDFDELRDLQWKDLIKRVEHIEDILKNP